LSESRKLAAIFAADVVGFSRLAGADEDRILARLRALRSDLIDPTIEVHRGRVVKRTGDGVLAEFRSVVDAVRCAIEVQNSMVERNAGVPADRRIVFRIGIHIGDVVEESDGDLMGDGVNIAARLEGVAKPGAICLSEDAYRQVRSRLDLKVSDLGLTPLKNIVEPMHIYSLEVGAPAEPRPAAVPPAEAAKPVPMKRGRSVAPLVASVAALLILAAAGAWITVGGRGSSPAEPTHLSIVVLPFANLSGDPSQDYFADDVTENLTDGLSRIRDSFVIARDTAFTYKGESVEAKQVGKDLGVRYVLEGSVQRDQGRVRVNAQLTDVDSKAQVWADRFEENIGDLPKLESRIVARIASSLHYELALAQTEKGKASQNPDAMDLALRGWAELEQTTALRAHREAAKPLFEQALGIDPNDSEALAGAAAVSMFEFFSGRNPDTDTDLKVTDQVDKAIALDPANIHAYRTKGQFLLASRHPREALRVIDAGLAVDSNSAPLLAMRSEAHTSLHRFEEAKSDLRQAMLLSPRDPSMPKWNNLFADAELGLGRYDAAIEASKKAIDGGYRVFLAYLNLAAAQALKGDDSEAKAALDEARRLNPRLSVRWLTEHRPVLEPAFDGLRKVGLPDE
jgi:adenylate cyclase